MPHQSLGLHSYDCKAHITQHAYSPSLYASKQSTLPVEYGQVCVGFTVWCTIVLLFGAGES